ncbi:MAG: cysteine desulfurase family protein [Pseudomonadota bacterium]
MTRAYLDYNAGAPMRPEAAAAVAATLGCPGNPSSVHMAGREARRRMEEARGRVAALVGGQPAGVVFTSGGTEANALALRGAGRRRVLASAVEHASVREAVSAEAIPVNRDGVVDLDAVDRLLATDPRPALVSVMLANNETGVIQPVARVADVARRHGALVHCDACQAPGRVPVSLSDLGVDFLTLSGHKLGGPAGIGALVLADPDFPLAPILLGGGQERRRRAGTENLPGIVGFGVAAAMAADDIGSGVAILEVCNLRDGLEAEARRRVPDAVIVGAGAPRIGNTTCLALPGVAAQIQVAALDLAGVMVSAGAACSSGKVAESQVLAAMGLGPAVAGSAVRVSLGWASRREDVDAFLDAWAELARRKGFRVNDAAQAA